MSEKSWCERNSDHPSWRGNGACWECNSEMFAEIKSLTAKGKIKDRALRVACHGLNLWVGDKDQSQRILRMRDQCLNAISGTLSSDPLHDDTGHQYGPSDSDKRCPDCDQPQGYSDLCSNPVHEMVSAADEHKSCECKHDDPWKCANIKNHIDGNPCECICHGL